MAIDRERVHAQICEDIKELENKINQPTKSFALSIAMRIADVYPVDVCSRHELFDILLETLLIRLGYGHLVEFIRKFCRWYG